MITKPKGTHDFYGEDASVYRYIADTFANICDLNNYSFIKTPTFESTNLFHRSVGETTDIVTKETYDFKDRGDRDLTLKPEGTAGVVRAVIENKLYANTNNYLKYYYMDSMFRYERPQAGRFREFVQFGVEVFGNHSPYIDAEIINLGVKFLEELKLENISIKINNLGSKEERENYRNALVKYFKQYESEMCEDCKLRLEKNPLRILDCKKDSDKDFIKNSPKISDYLGEESEAYFKELLECLDSLEIKYEIDETLVRGLDYYDYAVFEFMTNNETLEGASTICAGGRYNNLVKNLDGPDLSGCGFAVGVERLMSIIKTLDLVPNSDTVDVYVAPIGENNTADALLIGTNLKDCGFKCEIDYRNTNLKNKLATASKINSKYTVIIGDEEIKNYTVILKDMATKEEKTISINNLADELYVNL